MKFRHQNDIFPVFARPGVSINAGTVYVPRTRDQIFNKGFAQWCGSAQREFAVEFTRPLDGNKLRFHTVSGDASIVRRHSDSVRQRAAEENLAWVDAKLADLGILLGDLIWVDSEDEVMEKALELADSMYLAPMLFAQEFAEIIGTPEAFAYADLVARIYNKSLFAKMLEAHGMANLKVHPYSNGDNHEHFMQKLQSGRMPWVLKPDITGSGFGTEIVTTGSGLTKAVTELNNNWGNWHAQEYFAAPGDLMAYFVISPNVIDFVDAGQMYITAGKTFSGNFYPDNPKVEYHLDTFFLAAEAIQREMVASGVRTPIHVGLDGRYHFDTGLTRITEANSRYCGGSDAAIARHRLRLRGYEVKTVKSSRLPRPTTRIEDIPGIEELIFRGEGPGLIIYADLVGAGDSNVMDILFINDAENSDAIGPVETAYRKLI